MKSDEKKQPEKPQKRKSERLSKREWEDIMGTNQPTYKRHKGALRQR